jgi:4'-phosphopantetheinyl transferase EntD
MIPNVGTATGEDGAGRAGYYRRCRVPVFRSPGFRALRDFAQFGISRSSGFRASRNSARFGLRRSEFSAVRRCAVPALRPLGTPV